VLNYGKDCEALADVGDKCSLVEGRGKLLVNLVRAGERSIALDATELASVSWLMVLILR
jgi:hypothetical protein